jgi:hypothetical protein
MIVGEVGTVLKDATEASQRSAPLDQLLQFGERLAQFLLGDAVFVAVLLCPLVVTPLQPERRPLRLERISRLAKAREVQRAIWRFFTDDCADVKEVRELLADLVAVVHLCRESIMGPTKPDFFASLFMAAGRSSRPRGSPSGPASRNRYMLTAAFNCSQPPMIFSTNASRLIVGMNACSCL